MGDSAGTLLVLGASGLVGGAVFFESKRRLFQTVGTYRKHPQSGLIPWDGQVSSCLDLMRTYEPGAVIYAVGMTNVDLCEEREEEAVLWNSTIPSEIAGLCRGQSRFVYFSTEYVFDGQAGPYTETDSINPLSAYGRSKARGEEEVLSKDPSAVVVRTTVVYGPEDQGKNFVAQLRRKLSRGERMSVPLDQLSSPTYSLDLAARILDLLEQEMSGIWHVAGPEVLDRFSFARLAAEAFNLDTTLLKPVTTSGLLQKAKRPLKAGLQIEKLNSFLGTGIMLPPSEGLAAFVTFESAASR